MTDTTTESIFLPFMCCIRFLEIYILLGSPSDEDDFHPLSFVIRSLSISLTSSATLEHLKFNIRFTGIVFNYDTFYDNLRDAVLWRHLDSIATHPTDATLQRVDISIRFAFVVTDEPDVDKVKKAVIDSLPLLRMKGILLVNAAGTVDGY